ncbi:MAG TPA: ABC transporter substrate-binding protein [Pelotomaculum sp.]|nr:ABC transporter substrate-binding protein [Pelotomaculum sp.]
MNMIKGEKALPKARLIVVTALAGVLAVVLLLLGGCSGSSSNGSNAGAGKEPYRIGAVVDISGSSSSLGVPERNTLQMLADRLNESGGINGHPLELTILDNKSDETEAVLAVKKLIDQQKVLAVIGCSASGTSMSMIDTVQKEQVPMISMAAASAIVEPVQERKWVFKTAQSDLVVVNRLMDYLKENNLTRVAFLYMNNSYGDNGRNAFKAAAGAAGLEIVAEEKFEATDKDMTPQLTRVKTSGAQATVVWAIPPSASIITKNYRDLSLEIPLLHSHGVGNQNFIDLAQGAADGVLLPIGKLTVSGQIPDSGPQKKVLDDYIADYGKRYNTPPNAFGGYAWDAFYLLVHAIEKAGPDRAGIRDQLEKTSNFTGVSGVFNLTPTDHNGLDEDSMVLVRIRNGQWELME